jgi:hypothetical protein
LNGVQCMEYLNKNAQLARCSSPLHHDQLTNVHAIAIDATGTPEVAVLSKYCGGTGLSDVNSS